jgi:hypothetical protein
MMISAIAASVSILVLSSMGSATAGVDKYSITDGERAACEADAMSLCSGAGQDEDKLIICMKINKASLTSGCRPVFDEGLRRRGLN